MSLKSKAKYFPSATQLRSWFEANHESASELWVGHHKKSTGRPRGQGGAVRPLDERWFL